MTVPLRQPTHRAPRRPWLRTTLAAAAVALAACGSPTTSAGADPAAERAAQPAAETATAIFAGGCFWCMEQPFDELPGVISTTSGYTGGSKKDPTYEEVSSGTTGHAESVEVVYDPAKVSYEELLAVYWHNTDPTTPNAQFCDHGSQYRPAIFYLDEEQHRLAEASKQRIERSAELPGPVVTQIVRAGPFYPAEGYHQDFYRTNPLRYRFYRSGCGRDARLKQLWGAEAGGH